MKNTVHFWCCKMHERSWFHIRLHVPRSNEWGCPQTEAGHF
jgi:hypothetical protein